MFAAILIVVFSLLVLIAALYFYFVRRPLPKIDGTVRLKGLGDEVEIIRDRWGIPHLYAQNSDDLFFAQGYVHAQDRLWQMELMRRLGNGTLAEVVGELALESDRFARIVGLRRAAQAELAAADEETRRVLEAYARGVNAFIKSHGHKLPLEFTILGLKPPPWTPVDTAAIGKVIAWGLSCNWESELLRASLIARLGEEKAAALEPAYPRGNPSIVPSQRITTNPDVGALILEQYRQVRRFLGPGGLGSNNWVVDGRRSVSGAPLLANDPHLSLQMPSVWYENHLTGAGFQVTGVSFPGVPGVIIGHNDRLAWGVTAAFPDVQDLYVEKVNPANPLQYQFQGQWEESLTVQEEIRIRGRKKPVVEEVVITRHGPLINSFLADKAGENHPLALRWAGLEGGQLAKSILLLNQAADWGEFVEALRLWSVPSQNFVYADVEGNIGFHMPGQVPIRAKGLGLTPVPGWTGEYEWVGYVPFEELPQVYNPPQGYIATANNRVVGDDYPYFITLEWTTGYRARRIVELLTSREKLSGEDFALMQMDLHCLPAEEMAPYIAALEPDDEWSRRAVECIKDWDYRLTADSVAATIYEIFQYHLLRLAFEEELGDLMDGYLGRGRLDVFPINSYLGRAAARLQQRLDQGQLPDETLLLALERAVAALRAELGDDVDGWRWGQLHQVTFSHPLGSVKPLNLIFNRGPFPVGGDADTICQAAYTPGFPPGPVLVGVSYRQIIDLSDWDRSVAVNASGQSGQPGSKHYGDMIDLWRKGEYHPLLFERARIEQEAEGRLILAPASP